MSWWQKIVAWYRRRFRGYVAAPRWIGGKGTAWQQHPREVISFPCRGVGRDGKVCHQVLIFAGADYVIREREHRPDCQEVSQEMLSSSEATFGDGAKNARIRANMLAGCDCPVTDARYIKICPSCGLGHWKQAL